MDIRQLRYFLTIAQEGQITRAAKQLNMEQPPLSRQLKLMEEELGVLLFERSGKQLQLTHAGELLQNRAASLLNQFNETLTEVKEIHAGIRGMLSIGAVVSCISLLPQRIQIFRQQYPEVTFKIREGDHSLLADQLDKRNIELAVTRLPFESSFGPERYAVRPLPSDPFVAVLPSSWESVSSHSEISMRELAEYPFLSLKTDQTIGMHERVIQEFKRGELEPHVICECSSVAIIVALVAEGIGATILPESVMSSFAIPNIRTLSITSADFQSDVGIVWLRDHVLSNRARHFLATFIE
ncbi:LysR family transcriptional regulator [Paenibacillus sp. FSL W8-0187]|uniref:LysR family transcriptional regulator n=1 Tax=Paenibacillus lautus TaxID=1401 RepID=A0A1R1AZA3_PAELA|nr:MULTISPECIES: LysR family transcriptional regulator [Paenibacillus]MBT2763664.1 LysR family transcriptional regulator [Paenibacillus sp. ISL-20]OME91402.1 LysR family transcriptional regulator [Paenibacillus lautus]GIP00319.1 HTH-type transcriptional regulator BsdA [Paenibacillus lautus]